MLKVRIWGALCIGLAFLACSSMAQNGSTKAFCNPCSSFQISTTTLKACPSTSNPQTAGSIIVSIMGGKPPFNTYIDNVLVSSNATVFYSLFKEPKGSYVVKVIDAAGCTAEKTVTIAPLPTELCEFVNCQVFAEAAPIPVSICPINRDQGLIAVGVYKAAGPINVNFYKDTMLFATFTNIEVENFPTVFTNFPNGTYDVEVIDTFFKTPPCISKRITVVVNNSCPKPARCSNFFLTSCCCP